MFNRKGHFFLVLISNLLDQYKLSFDLVCIYCVKSQVILNYNTNFDYRLDIYYFFQMLHVIHLKFKKESCQGDLKIYILMWFYMKYYIV